MELVKVEERVTKSKGELFMIKTLQVGREMTEVYRGIQNPAWCCAGKMTEQVKQSQSH